MSHQVHRRSFLGAAGLAGAAAVAGLPGTATAQETRLACSNVSDGGPLAIPETGTHLVTLGTKGGPTVRTDRIQPANLLMVDGRPYVIDCGQGVTRQLVLAGVPLADVRAVFITHHHSDHNLEFGNLANAAWNANLTEPITFVAPPPIRQMVNAYLKLNRFDIRTRIADQGLPELAPLIRVEEFRRPGVIYEDEHVRVTAELNTHPPVDDSYAYRFDTAHGSVVFSGDTTPDHRVIELAQGADWLVHEVLHLPTLEDLIESQPTETTLRDHLLASHTTNEQVSEVAAAAGVEALVLSHLVYFGDVGEDQWLADSRGDWPGPLIVARDLGMVF